MPTSKAGKKCSFLTFPNSGARRGRVLGESSGLDSIIETNEERGNSVDWANSGLPMIGVQRRRAAFLIDRIDLGPKTVGK
jgi:hypothetical protein